MTSVNRRFLLAILAAAGCSDLASQPERVPASLELLPADAVILEGEAVRYQFRVLDEGGAAFDRVPAWAPPRWSVSDPSVAEVDADGEVIGLEGGRETRVAAEVASMQAGAWVRVNPTSVKIEASAVHLTQAVQTLGGDVPLIAGRSALLRVFFTGDKLSFYRPRPLATFYQDGAPIHEMRLDPAVDRIPTEPEEGRLDRSFNVVVPGLVVQPRVELVVELDPDGAVPAVSGSDRRVPAEGRLRLDVLTVPPMELTVVPVVHSADSEAILTWVEGITETSPGMEFVRSILPIGELELTVNEPYRTTADLGTVAGWLGLLREISVLRLTERRSDYYYAAVAAPPNAPLKGLGYIGLPIGVGIPDVDTFAHELGHNMGLRHAPCGLAVNPDPDFPYEDGSIGVFGYETRGGNTQMVDPAEYWDLMTYCDPSWISDYHFIKAMEFRREHESLVLRSVDPEPTLLLWGNAGTPDLLLEPAFVLDAPPKLPAREGPYRLEGFDAAGRPLFSFPFTPDELEYGGGQFAFAIPYDDRWGGPEGLDHVRLSGPDGSVTVERSGSRRASLVMDPDTGRLRGILRGREAPPPWADDMEIVASDGVPLVRVSGPRQ
ncbi:M66 family metalloprotease [Candidatus Palauibacter polyketidifaciens]|uniref:M66 family metalloprotease n=1 Tax=Candidatus Palauibacter polyketidifaciens TaxID=3056740 RepID=UPI0023A29ECD|nr:M66 family metalloprotease [Candidatus Palauibacter polyketidifaciens]MDE2720942.1 M66 family metalloprotease [Candidatus Palauibacter polyketidifaciens]